MRIVVVPCLRDNYAYIVIAACGDAVVVDASDAKAVRQALGRERARPRAIWSTHHHMDHVGGNEELASEYGLEVVGHASDSGRLAGLTRGVEHGDVVGVEEIRARCLHVPGHTSGAVCYFIEEIGAAFTGDTLFSAGCGRLFEGTPAQMVASLSTLAALPGNTCIYSGHEYTEDNLRFAVHVEPGNPDLVAARTRAVELRDRLEPTVGTTLEQERRTNPFLRLYSQEIQQTLSISPGSDPIAVFAKVRRAKDRFR
jgi:hydroxyacylglutathione hydrolase